LNELSDTSQLLSQSDFWLAGLKTLAMLSIVLGCLILVLFLVKRFFYKRNGVGQDRIIKVLTSHHVSPKGRIALIDVAGEKLLIGITSENITCLGKIEQSQAICSLEKADPLGKGKGAFEGLLTAFLKGKSGSDDRA
jgi:flagellar protein FliO/FliZ